MLVMAAMAEIQPKNVGPGVEERADRGGIGAGRAEGGDDLGIA
jgi:hypothetical protein